MLELLLKGPNCPWIGSVAQSVENQSAGGVFEILKTWEAKENFWKKTLSQAPDLKLAIRIFVFRTVRAPVRDNGSTETRAEALRLCEIQFRTFWNDSEEEPKTGGVGIWSFRIFWRVWKNGRMWFLGMICGVSGDT